MVITVLLADDHGVLRDGVQRLLEASADIRVIATCGDGLKALDEAARLRPDVVVMDISMPALNGLEATRRIARAAPESAVVILSMHSSPELTREAFAAGARGYLLKESAGGEVVKAVRAVASGRRFLGEGLADVVMDPGETPLGRLTPRELEVLQHVAQGKSNAETAAALGLSPRSVETYRLRLMDKLGIEDFASLVKFAIRHGITTLD